MIPTDFLDRMKKMLGSDYPAFLSTYDGESFRALSVNPRKATAEQFLKNSPFHLEPVPWNKNGFYYDADDAPGKHPYHAAGVYYIQEPSAMAPAAYLGAKPGERVLDLCAAPGGKSAQIAAAMDGQGILISNEINGARARALSENMERMGAANCIVTSESPQTLAGRFPVFFDRILVDAPCSGEGMFRKNPDACDEWSPGQVKLCATRQLEILNHAADMLRPGGTMVYSTCTFSLEENEGAVNKFLKSHTDFYAEKIDMPEGMCEGNPEWANDGNPAENLENCVRLFPHKLRGEGHFFAVLKKDGDMPQVSADTENFHRAKEFPEYKKFCDEYLKINFPERLLTFGDQLYLAPEDMPILKGLKALRPGLHLGTLKKGRFEPAHALALALSPGDVKNVLDLPSDGDEIRAYLNGQTISCDGDKGWHLITTDGYGVGWGKLAGGVMKNHYPKGLRR